jgi:hypothetical protein
LNISINSSSALAPRCGSRSRQQQCARVASSHHLDRRATQQHRTTSNRRRAEQRPESTALHIAHFEWLCSGVTTKLLATHRPRSGYQLQLRHRDQAIQTRSSNRSRCFDAETTTVWQRDGDLVGRRRVPRTCVGDIVAILNDSGERIMPIDECNIVRGPAPRVVQLNGSRPSCAGPIIADSRSRATTRAVRGILHDTSTRRARDNVGSTFVRNDLANGAALDVDRPALAQRHIWPQIRRVLAATAAVEWIDAIDIEEAITVERCQRCDCRVALRLQISLLKVFYCGGDLPPNVKRNQLRQATTTTGVL